MNALPPDILHKVLEENILKYMDKSKYDEILKQEEKDIEELQDFIDNRDEVD